MASGITKTDICNLALDLVKEAPISDVDAGTDDISKWFRRNYDIARDALLADHTWNFAIISTQIAANVTAPTSRWRYGYQLPSDCLRVLPLRYGNYFEGALIPFEVNGQVIETNEAAPLKLRYIARIETEGLFSPVFVEALSAKLGMKIAHWITGKASALQIAQQVYEEAMARAKRADGLEGTFERPYDDDVIGVRYAGGYAYDGWNT